MPDTNAPPPVFEIGQVNDASAAASAVVEAVVRWDECVSLIGQPGFDAGQALDQAAHELRKQAVRCVRVAGSVNGGLTLRALIAQVLGRAGPDTLTNADLQAGFEALVEPGPGNQRVALLIGDAQTLHPASLRYIQLACRTSPKLRVVLAGQAGLSRHLAADEFSELRRRITRRLVMPGAASASSANALPPAPSPPPAPAPAPSWQVVRLGLIALLALLIGTMVWRHLPRPPEVGTRTPAPMTEVPAKPAVQAAASAVPAAEPEPPGAGSPLADQAGARAPAPVLVAEDPAEPAVQPVANAVPVAKPEPLDAGSPPDQSAPQADASPLASAPASDAAASPSSVPAPEPSAADAPGPAALQEGPVVVDLPSLQDAELLEAVANASPTSIPDEAPAPDRPPSAGNAADQPAAAPDAARLEPARLPQNRRPSGRAQRAVAPKTPPSRPSRDAAAQTAAPFPTADQRRCREINMRSQLGRTPTGSEIEFLRTGCRSK